MNQVRLRKGKGIPQIEATGTTWDAGMCDKIAFEAADS